MLVIVSGGAGFIGSHICEALLKKGHTVIALDDLSGGVHENVKPFETSPGYPQFQFYFTDCAKLENMHFYCKSFKPDVFVHCAANAREGASQFQPYSVTMRNMLAHAAVVSAVCEHNVKRLINFSSMSVYGHGNYAPPFNESLPRAPEDVYGVNKAAQERVCEIMSSVHGFQYMTIRPHNVAGIRQALYDKFRNVIGIMMNCIMREEPIFIYGDGTQTRAFSYIEDSLPAFVRAITCSDDYFKSALQGECVNVGGRIPMSINELAKLVILYMEADADYPIQYLPNRPCEVKHAFTSYQLSERLLGYKEKVGIVEGIHRMAQWALTQGPKEWRWDEGLEIVNDKTPKTWIRDVEPTVAGKTNV